MDRNAWVPAGELRVGERLLAADGSTPCVESFTPRPEPEPVYNIEVEGDHCYRVGEQGLLVHNASEFEHPYISNCGDPCKKIKPKAGKVPGPGAYKGEWEVPNVKGEDIEKFKGKVCRVHRIEGLIHGGKTSEEADVEQGRTEFRTFLFAPDDQEDLWTRSQKKLRKKYQAGHLIANELGGPSTQPNFTAFLAKLNLAPGWWRRMEQYIGKCFTKRPTLWADMVVKATYDKASEDIERYIPILLTVTLQFKKSKGETITERTAEFDNLTGSNKMLEWVKQNLGCIKGESVDD